MAASSASDIPDGASKGKYCVCNNCKISREEGREEIRVIVRNLANKFEQEEDQLVRYELIAKRIHTELGSK